jgi:hypothetical protein
LVNVLDSWSSKSDQSITDHFKNPPHLAGGAEAPPETASSSDHVPCRNATGARSVTTGCTCSAPDAVHPLRGEEKTESPAVRRTIHRPVLQVEVQGLAIPLASHPRSSTLSSRSILQSQDDRHASKRHPRHLAASVPWFAEYDVYAAPLRAEGCIRPQFASGRATN